MRFKVIDWEKLDALNRIYVGPREDPRKSFVETSRFRSWRLKSDARNL
jgi:hypothetical protein